jgi:hypothetical protein
MSQQEQLFEPSKVSELRVVSSKSKQSRARPERLPPTLDVVTAGRMLGIGRTLAYSLVRTGRWPTRIIRLGSSIRIPTQAVLDLLTGASESYPQVLHEPSTRDG